MPNIAQIAQIQGNYFLAGLVKSIANQAKLFTTFDVRTSESDKTLAISAGEVPSMEFLHFGEGLTSKTSGLEMGEFQLARLGGAVEEHEHKVMKWDKENAAAIGAGLEFDWMSFQMMQRSKGGILSLESQMIYGRANDPKGFPGLKELTPGTVAANVIAFTGGKLVSDPASDGYARSVLNVGGTTNGNASSAYSVKFGILDTQLVIHGEYDNGGFLSMVKPHREWLSKPDPVTGTQKSSWYIVSEATGWSGLIVSGSNEDATRRRYVQFSVRRAMNLTDEAGKGLTPFVLDALAAMHPDGSKPDAFYVAPRDLRNYNESIGARQQLFVNVNNGPQSRNFDYGTVDIARHNGIPIYDTDRIKANEAIETPV